MKKTLEYTTREEDRVPGARKIFYGLAAAADPMFNGTLGNYLVMFYNAVLGLPAGPIGFWLFVPRLWDAITDPLLGQLSDRTRSRWGRRRPYILVGGIGACVFYALHWAPPHALGSGTSLLVYVVVINCLYYTFSTVFLIPYQALGIELSPDYKERTSIMAIRKIFNALGDTSFGLMPWAAVSIAGLLGATTHRSGYGVVGVIIGAIAFVLIIATFLGTHERTPIGKPEGKIEFFAMFKTLGNPLFLHFIAATFIFVLSLMSLASYHTYLFLYYLNAPGLLAVWGVLSCLAHIPLAFFWWWVANHVGKSRAIFLAMSTICIGCFSTLVAFNRDFPYLVFIYGALFAAGWCGFQVLSPAILADIVDYDELRTGARREGVLAGMYGFWVKIGFASAGMVLGFGVDWAGFVPDLGPDQTDQTFLKLRLLTAVLSGAFAALSALAYLFFPLTPERALITRRALEERRGKVEAVH